MEGVGTVVVVDEQDLDYFAWGDEVGVAVGPVDEGVERGGGGG